MMLLMQTITMTIIFSFIRIFNCLFNKEQSENVLWVFVFNRLLSFTPLQLGCQNYICWFFDCSKFNLFLIFFFSKLQKKGTKTPLICVSVDQIFLNTAFVFTLSLFIFLNVFFSSLLKNH